MAIARDSAQGLLAVINDILDYSRLEAGAVELETTDVRRRRRRSRRWSSCSARAPRRRASRSTPTSADDLPRDGGRRPDAAAAGAVQPRRQRDQVHPARRGADRADGSAGSATARSSWPSRCRTPASASRPRRSTGCSSGSARPRLDGPALRRDRPRAGDLARAGPADGRRHRGRERAGCAAAASGSRSAAPPRPGGAGRVRRCRPPFRPIASRRGSWWSRTTR